MVIYHYSLYLNLNLALNWSFLRQLPISPFPTNFLPSPALIGTANVFPVTLMLPSLAMQFHLCFGLSVCLSVCFCNLDIFSHKLTGKSGSKNKKGTGSTGKDKRLARELDQVILGKISTDKKFLRDLKNKFSNNRRYQVINYSLVPCQHRGKTFFVCFMIYLMLLVQVSFLNKIS